MPIGDEPAVAKNAGRRDSVMGRKMEYCQRLAAECAQRAQETEDAEEREFLNRMRDNWLQVAKGLQALEDNEKLGAG